jgi:hypothetical protein
MASGDWRRGTSGGVTADGQQPVMSGQGLSKHLPANRSRHVRAAAAAAQPLPAARRNPRAPVYFVPLGMVMNGMLLLPSM